MESKAGFFSWLNWLHNSISIQKNTQRPPKLEGEVESHPEKSQRGPWVPQPFFVGMGWSSFFGVFFSEASYV